jgi:hypothetical protein
LASKLSWGFWIWVIRRVPDKLGWFLLCSIKRICRFLWMMRLLRVTRDWNRRFLFSRRESISLKHKYHYSFVKMVRKARKTLNLTEKDIKSVNHMKLIKFGGTWLPSNRNHYPWILEVSVRVFCTQIFKKFGNRESN